MNWTGKGSSIESRGAFYQFALGTALIFALPLLSLWYLRSVQYYEPFGRDWPWTAIYVILNAVLVVSGYLILRRAPSQIVQLRRSIEHVVEKDLATKADEQILKNGNDFEAINACMRLLVQELRVRIDTMESERKELQKHLMQAQKIEGLGTMATGVAHDFNNLLAAILGNTSILLNAVAKDSPVRENALQIQTSASQAAELTNKMAIYSGRCRFDPVPIDINAVIRDTADIVRGLVYRAIDVDTRLADDLPSIHADPAHVRELLTQLVRNASEAIMTRGRKGRIGIGTGVLDCDGKYLAGAVLQEKQAEGRYVYIEVTDDGCGIPSEVQTRMFDPFFTTKIRAQGMGLAVVLGIVRAHGGVIRVTSAPAEGATFRILLPGDEIRPTFE